MIFPLSFSLSRRTSLITFNSPPRDLIAPRRSEIVAALARKSRGRQRYDGSQLMDNPVFLFRTVFIRTHVPLLPSLSARYINSR